MSDQSVFTRVPLRPVAHDADISNVGALDDTRSNRLVGHKRAKTSHSNSEMTSLRLRTLDAGVTVETVRVYF